MIIGPGELTFAIGLGLGATVWAVRVEGRVNEHTTLFSEREKFTAREAAEIKRVVDDRHEDVKIQLNRIEDKMDEQGARLRSYEQAICGRQ